MMTLMAEGAMELNRDVGVGVFVGGGLVALVTWVVKKWYSDSRVDKESLYSVLKSQVEKLEAQRAVDTVKHEAEIKAMETQARERDIEIARLRMRVEQLEQTHAEVPFPTWTKDNRGRYIRVNTAFIEQFLLPNGKTHESVIGKTDGEVWGDQSAYSIVLADLDRRARTNANNLAKSHGIKPPGKISQGTYSVVKYPVMRGPTNAGWEGWAFPDADV